MAKIKLRRDTAANWASANPVLSLGEPGYDTTALKLKIGDGITTWANLTYLTSTAGQQDRLVNGSANLILTGGANPYLTFPAISNGDQLGIQGSEVVSLSGTLALSSPTDIALNTNGANAGGIGSQGWNFGADGNLVLPAGGDILDSNGVSVLGGVGGPTGNLIINDSAINFVASSSSDVSGLSTIQLVPDTNAYANDQYLVIDPTQPNHIHIRAGGTIDNSNAVLFLGGEKLRVQVTDNYAAGVYNDSVVFDSDATFTAGSADYTTATFTENSPTVGTISMTVVSQAVLNKIWALNSVSMIQIYNGTTYYYLKPDGNSGTPGPGLTANFGVTRIEPGDSWPTDGDTLLEVYFQINQIRQSKLEVNGSDVRIEAADDVRLYSRDVFSLHNYSTTQPIRVITQYDQNVEYAWEFQASGNLQLPQTNMNASPQPVSYPGIRFTDGTFQTTAFTGTEFPTNIVNTHSGTAVIYVGGTQASTESLSVRVTNVSNTLGVEVKYSTTTTSSISAFRAYPNPANIYSGLFTKSGSNNDWDNFGNLTTVGDSISVSISDHSNHKIYRVLVTARAIPDSGSTVGDAYCVIEKLK